MKLSIASLKGWQVLLDMKITRDLSRNRWLRAKRKTGCQWAELKADFPTACREMREAARDRRAIREAIKKREEENEKANQALSIAAEMEKKAKGKKDAADPAPLEWKSAIGEPTQLIMELLEPGQELLPLVWGKKSEESNGETVPHGTLGEEVKP